MRTPHHAIGRERFRPSPVWTLGDLLGSPTGGAKTKRISQTGLPRQSRNNAGQPSISDAFQCGGGQCHQNMAVHDSGGPEGGPQRSGRYRQAVYGSLLCMVGSRDKDWLQHSMNILVDLFLWHGLVVNVAKSCTMACQPGALLSGMSAEAKSLKCTGVGDSYRVIL